MLQLKNKQVCFSKNKQGSLLRNKNSLICIVVILFTILYTYKDLPRTFYQQDEWNGLGLMFVEGWKFAIDGFHTPLDILLGKGRILSNFVLSLFLINFPFQNSQMAIFAIGLHIVATILVYLLIRK